MEWTDHRMPPMALPHHAIICIKPWSVLPWTSGHADYASRIRRKRPDRYARNHSQSGVWKFLSEDGKPFPHGWNLTKLTRDHPFAGTRRRRIFICIVILAPLGVIYGVPSFFLDHFRRLCSAVIILWMPISPERSGDTSRVLYPAGDVSHDIYPAPIWLMGCVWLFVWKFDGQTS